MQKTRKQLLKEIRIKARITNVETEAFYNSFVKVLAEQLKTRKELKISGFGKFSLIEAKARNITLPNGNSIKAPERNKIKFAPFKELKQSI
ncbi:MAG: HU family DNA-binding protein [Candidatus Rifleibacteriota bacterium]